MRRFKMDRPITPADLEQAAENADKTKRASEFVVRYMEEEIQLGRDGVPMKERFQRLYRQLKDVDDPALMAERLEYLAQSASLLASAIITVNVLKAFAPKSDPDKPEREIGELYEEDLKRQQDEDEDAGGDFLAHERRPSPEHPH